MCVSLLLNCISLVIKFGFIEFDNYGVPDQHFLCFIWLCLVPIVPPAEFHQQWSLCYNNEQLELSHIPCRRTATHVMFPSGFEPCNLLSTSPAYSLSYLSWAIYFSFLFTARPGTVNPSCDFSSCYWPLSLPDSSRRPIHINRFQFRDKDRKTQIESYQATSDASTPTDLPC